MGDHLGTLGAVGFLFYFILLISLALYYILFYFILLIYVAFFSTIDTAYKRIKIVHKLVLFRSKMCAL